MKSALLLCTLLEFASFICYLSYHYSTQLYILAKASGLMININLFLVFVCSNKIWKRWFVYNSIVKRHLHVFLFGFVCFFSCVHIITHTVNIILYNNYNGLVSGIVLSCGLFFFVTLGFRVYNLFHKLHNLFVVVFLIAFAIHIVWKNNIVIGVLGLTIVSLYIINFVLDLFYSGGKVSIIGYKIITDDIICINMLLSNKYFSKTVYLYIPEINKFEWHPYTIVKCSNTNGILKGEQCCIYIKRRGDWSGKLVDTIVKRGYDNLNLYISGPYKTFHDDFIVKIHCEPVVLISSGIGITCFLDFIMENKPKSKLYVVIIAKNMDDIFWIKSISLHGVRFMIYLTDNKCKESFTQQDHLTYYNGRPDFNDLFDNILIQNSFIETNKITIYFSGSENVYNKIEHVSKKYDTFRLIYSS